MGIKSGKVQSCVRAVCAPQWADTLCSVPRLAIHVSGPWTSSVLSIQRDPRKVDTHLSVFDPLVLNTPREPLSSGNTIRFEPRILWFLNSFRHHLAQIRHRLKNFRLSRASKEHQGPTGVLALLTWWLTKCVSRNQWIRTGSRKSLLTLHGGG